MNPGATTRPADVDTRAAASSIARRDPRDRVSFDGDVGPIPRAAGAVDDAAVADDEVVSRRLGTDGA